MEKFNDDLKYKEYLERQFITWEDLCRKCGACCGLFDGDPCEHLLLSENKDYQCGIYDNRFGIKKTVSKKDFKCVPLRDIMHKSWSGDQDCGYKEFLRNNTGI